MHIPEPIDSVSVQMLKTVLAQKFSAGVSPASLARLASSWRGFFKFLCSRGHLLVNPASGLKTPKLAKSLPKAVGVDQLIALLNKPIPKEFRFAQAHVLVDLLYCTGLRIKEALSLTVSIFDETEELLVLGKGNKSRVIPIVNNLRDRLKEFSICRKNHLLQLGTVQVTSLFISIKGRPLSVRQAQIDLARYSLLSGLGQHLHPHMLRHSFGSHMLQATQNLRAVQELLGHASITSTQIYTALDFEHLSSVYDKAFPRAK
jgi:integrase/recombinase XerC